MPLIAIADAPDVAAVDRARASLADFDWIVFVSPTAVARLLGPDGALARWPAAGVRAAAPGAGTAEALLAAGVPADRIVAPADDSGRADAEALWATLTGGDSASLRGDRVLVVRGTEGRDWLTDRFVEAGARVETLAAYHRTDAALDVAGRRVVETALADPGGHVWLVASGSAVDALVRALGDERGTLGAATAIATHPNIAERARAAGFGRVRHAEAGFAAVVRCIESAGP